MIIRIDRRRMPSAKPVAAPSKIPSSNRYTATRFLLGVAPFAARSASSFICSMTWAGSGLLGIGVGESLAGPSRTLNDECLGGMPNAWKTNSKPYNEISRSCWASPGSPEGASGSILRMNSDCSCQATKPAPSPSVRNSSVKSNRCVRLGRVSAAGCSVVCCEVSSTVCGDCLSVGGSVVAESSTVGSGSGVAWGVSFTGSPAEAWCRVQMSRCCKQIEPV